MPRKSAGPRNNAASRRGAPAAPDRHRTAHPMIHKHPHPRCSDCQLNPTVVIAGRAYCDGCMLLIRYGVDISKLFVWPEGR